MQYPVFQLSNGAFSSSSLIEIQMEHKTDLRLSNISKCSRSLYRVARLIVNTYFV